MSPPPVVAVGGGWSSERDVSIKTMEAVLAALDNAGWDARGHDLEGPGGIAGLPGAFGPGEVALLCLHGNGGGEEGLVQAVLEAAGIPYTGSGPAASALAIDKPRAKDAAASAGAAVLPHALVGEGDPMPSFPGFGPGLAVKPADHGSSDGISLVADRAGYRAAVSDAARLGRVMVEPAVEGQEVTVGVLGEGDGARALAPVRVRPTAAFYDRASKYTPEGSEYDLDPDLGESGEEARRVSLAVHRAFRCRGATRSDFILADRLWFLEVNTLPGMTPLSLLPMSAEGAGIGFVDLLAELVAAA